MIADESPSLPRRPHKARILGAQYPPGANGVRTAYENTEQVVCQMFVGATSEKYAPIGDEWKGSKPIAFKFEDEDVVFEDSSKVEYLGDMTVTKFGCV